MMETKTKLAAKFLLIDGKANILKPEIKTKIDNANVVFFGNKLAKNSSEAIRDRVGTLFAKSEIANAQRNFRPNEVEVIAA